MCFHGPAYAQARGEHNGWTIRVSVKSVNHRFLDVRFRLPEGVDVYELRLRKSSRTHSSRHIDVNVNVQPGAASQCRSSRLVQTYAQSAEEIRRQLGSDAGWTVVSLGCVCRGVIGASPPPLPEREDEDAGSASAKRSTPLCAKPCSSSTTAPCPTGRHIAENYAASGPALAQQADQVRDLAKP